MPFPAHSKPLLFLLTAVLCLSVLALPTTAFAQENDDDAEETEVDDAAQEGQRPTATLQRGGRMEFDARLVRGERAGSGAVFLFQRPPRPLPSMIERRTTYLDGTVYSVLGEDGVERLREAREGQ